MSTRAVYECQACGLRVVDDTEDGDGFLEDVDAHEELHHEEAPAAAATAPGRETPTNQEERPTAMFAPSTDSDQPDVQAGPASAGEWVVIARPVPTADLAEDGFERWEIHVHRPFAQVDPIASTVVDVLCWGDRTILLGALDDAAEDLGYMRDGARRGLTGDDGEPDTARGLSWVAWPVPKVPVPSWASQRKTPPLWESRDDETGELTACHELQVGTVASAGVALYRFDTARAGIVTPGPVSLSVWGDDDLDLDSSDPERLAALIEDAARIARELRAAS